mgnify:FL=1
MKTQKTTTTIIAITLVVLGLVVAIPFSVGMYAGIKSHTGASGEILSTLKKECDCKEISVDHSVYGFQYSVTEGATSERASYTLKGCKINGSVSEEIERLNTILIAEVAGYKNLDLVQFQFETNGTEEVVTVKNGTLE